MDYVVWTDGACVPNPGRGGAAAIVISESGERTFLTDARPLTTNNRMEALAVTIGLEATPEGSTVHVCTDSRTVLAWLRDAAKGEQPWTDERYDDTVDARRFRDAVRSRTVVRYWVRGHSGYELNELADQMAQEARCLTSTG